MSDEYVDVDVQTEAPDLGQADVSDGAETADVPILELDQYRDYRVPVKIEGQEDYVPLTEAVAGYQRQADYTRKTQELAQQRNDLGWASAIKAALEQDPEGTLHLLSAHYGVNPQPAPQQAQKPASDPFDDWMSDDPWDSPKQSQQQVDPRYEEIATRLARIEQERADATLRSEVARLQATYADFNPQEVVAHALRMNTTDLETAYKQIAFDKVFAERQQLAEQVRQAQAQRTAKQEASIISGGSTVQGGGLDGVGEVRSIAEAWAAAKRQLSK